jgi:glyoxylase-like metal-dependent hydrolase (beta-lactamase superfamily II)
MAESATIHRLQLATFKPAGHQSVLVESGTARYLVAAQATFSVDEYEHGGNPEVQAHGGLTTEYLASIARLKALNAQSVCFSHDSQWSNRQISERVGTSPPIE